MTTEKIYLKEMYTTEADAIVLEVSGNQVVLDKTIFYAESGGQLSDKGTINGQVVSDCQKRISPETKMLTHPEFPSINVNMDVVHTMESENHGLSVGDLVHLKLDWERRFSIMRLHSAAHVVWHFTGELAGDLPVKGCLIGPDKARLDFGGKIDPEIIPELSRLSNNFITGAQEIQNIPLESEPEALFWICADIKIPCGGTHVSNTSEIGEVVLKRRSQGKKLDRLYISF